MNAIRSVLPTKTENELYWSSQTTSSNFTNENGESEMTNKWKMIA